MIRESYEFAPVGVSEDNKIIFLIDDKEYGGYSIAIKIMDAEDNNLDPKDCTIPVEYDFLSDGEIDVPIERQQSVVFDIVETIVKQAINFEE